MKETKKNGTAYHWLIVVCCCCIATAGPGLINNTVGVLYRPIAESLGVGLGSVSMYLTIQNITCGFACPIAVKLSRKVNLRLMMLVGLVVCALCYVGMANATAVWQFYVLGGIVGVSASAFFLNWALTVLSNWFHKRAGLVTGIAASFSGVSGAVLSPIFNQVVERFGWRTTYLVLAGTLVLVLLPPMLFIRLHPSEKGLGRYGEDSTADTAAPAAAKAEERSFAPTEKTALNFLTGAVVAVALVCGLGSHMASYAASVGLSSAAGALMISAAMIGNSSSKIVVGSVSDAIGAKRTMFLTVGCIVAGLLSLTLLSAAGTAVLLSSTVLMGFAYSFGTVLTSALAKKLFGVERFAAAYAYINLFGNIASALGVSMVGYSFDLFHSFTPVLLLCVALTLTAMVLVVGAYRIQSKYTKVS